jgi:hypothetical protein
MGGRAGWLGGWVGGWVAVQRAGACGEGRGSCIIEAALLQHFRVSPPRAYTLHTLPPAHPLATALQGVHERDCSLP